MRAALEQAQPTVRRLIQLVHAHVLRFRLGPSQDPDHVLGWRIVVSRPDIVQLEATGWFGQGVIVARRTSSTTATATTYVFYARPSSPWLWRVVGPLHRRVGPYLLRRVARTMSRTDHDLTMERI